MSSFLGAGGSGGGGGGTPAAPFNSIQFNNAGAFGGDQNLEWIVGTGLQIGSAAGTLTGLINFVGKTSGAVALSVQDVAGSWTMKLPTTAGTNGFVLQTDGAGNTSWVVQSGSAGAITVGTTTISGGTSGHVVYDAAGIFQEASQFTIVSGQPNVLLATGNAYLLNSIPVLTRDGNDNVFVGQAGNSSLTGIRNFGEGPGALGSLTSGQQNMAMGYFAGSSLTTGTQNMLMGVASMQFSTGAFQCVAIGSQAMQFSGNSVAGAVAIGAGAGNGFNGGGQIAIGALAGSGSSNEDVLAIGTAACRSAGGGGGSVGVHIGNNSSAGITTGINNLIIGSIPGGLGTNNGLNTGSNNVIIGNNTGVISGSLSGNIIIADGTGSYKIQFDGSNWILQGLANQISQPTTVGGLPAPGTKNRRGFVTDATATMAAGVGTIVAGTGGNNVPVYDDGTNWRIG